MRVGIGTARRIRNAHPLQQREGLAARGAVAFATTFACFLTRAADFIRMSGLSNARHQLNVKLTGSHAGVSIGEDGPSQMALEDLAMMRAVPDCAVLYPCDAVSTERLVVEMAAYHGLAYMRTSRPKTDVIYGPDEEFAIGGSRVIRSSADDKLTIVAAGITLHEALRAADQLAADGIAVRVIDLYSIKPLDRDTVVESAGVTGRVLTVEDHWPEGGIGEAVLTTLAEAGLSVAARLSGPWYQISGYTFHDDWDKYSLPPKVRHGAMITISRKQYNALVARFGIEQPGRAGEGS